MQHNVNVRLHGIKDLRVENDPMPEPRPGEVLLKPAFVGVCGTDLHFYNEGGVGSYVLEKPTTLGHEISAVVSQLGDGVDGLEVGDQVTVDVMDACGDCFYCLKQRRNLCLVCKIAGIPNTDGGFSNFFVTSASTCYRLPEGISLEEGALTEPLSISVWGFRRCPVIQGETVVILGAGTIGLLASQVARAHGAGKVLVVDVQQSRLDLATQLGADLVLKVDPKANPNDNAAQIKDALGGESDLCVECSGAPGTVDTAILSTRRAGRLLMLGLGQMSMHVHLGLAALNEVDVIGAICNNAVFPECMELLASGKVKVKPLISRKLPLAEVKDALELIERGDPDVIKILIECQK